MYQLNLTKTYQERIKQEKVRQMRFIRSKKFRRINSLDLIPEDPKLEELQENQQDEHNAINNNNNNNNNNNKNKYINNKNNYNDFHSDTTHNTDHEYLINIKNENENGQENSTTITKTISKIIIFFLEIIVNLILTSVRYFLCIPLCVAAPSFWLSALLWLFWKITHIPLYCLKWLLNIDMLHLNNNNIQPQQKQQQPRRTVLLSGGSTLQTLQLARNLYLSGARVIVIEFEGLFFLTRFSSAVDKFYAVPRPTSDNADDYIAALYYIVKREKPNVYIPVCATNAAYYDALAKPHLELLGCSSFIPNLQETIILDDCLKFYEKCTTQNIPLPAYQLLSSTTELMNCYDSGFINNNNNRNILFATGKQGLLERHKFILPNKKNNLNFTHQISENQPWLLVRDIPGEHYLTCTTIKDSRVVVNLSCRIEETTNNLIPVVNADALDNWVATFFAKVRFQRHINGHISIRLVKCQETGKFLPLGIRLGVSLPYLCYRNLKCEHKKVSGLTTEHTTTKTTTKTIKALDKREALFAYWDPLPYCAYYHFQLPFTSLKTFLQKRQQKINKKPQ